MLTELLLSLANVFLIYVIHLLLKQLTNGRPLAPIGGGVVDLEAIAAPPFLIQAQERAITALNNLAAQAVRAQGVQRG